MKGKLKVKPKKYVLSSDLKASINVSAGRLFQRKGAC